MTADFARVAHLYQNTDPVVSSGGVAPQRSEDDLQEAMRGLRRAEAARRFVEDRHIPSGPGQSSSVYHLPELPTHIPFLSGGMPMHYKIREVPTNERYTLPGLSDDDIINVRVGEVRRVYSMAMNYWGYIPRL